MTRAVELSLTERGTATVQEAVTTIWDMRDHLTRPPAATARRPGAVTGYPEERAATLRVPS